MRATRRATRLIAALALTTAPVAVTAASHTVAGAATVPAPPVIKVVMGTTAADMTVDTVNPRRAGRVTFDVTSTDTENDHQFQIAKLAKGVTLQQVIDEVTSGLENEQNPDLNSLRAFERDVTLIGGVDVAPRSPGGSVTLTLRAGVYYLLDVSGPAAEALPAAKRLVVQGSVQPTSWPGAAATVTMAAPNVFSVNAHMPADGSILVRNTSDEPHFLVIQQVNPGATDAQIQAVFDQVMNGNEDAFKDFPGSEDAPSAATGVISPGYQTLFTYHLTPGQYALMCFWPSDETGAPHAFMGMHKVVYIG